MSKGTTRTAAVIFDWTCESLQLYLFPSMKNIAVLFVSLQIKRCNFICSFAVLVLQFYMFSCTFNVTVLSVPLVCSWNSFYYSPIYNSFHMIHMIWIIWYYCPWSKIFFVRWRWKSTERQDHTLFIIKMSPLRNKKNWHWPWYWRIDLALMLTSYRPNGFSYFSRY